MKKTINTFILAILAGFCIGLGGNVFLALIPINKIVGAILFTVGLFTICTHGLNLFTGKACYIFDNDLSYIPTLIIIWLGNLLGTWLMSFIVSLTRLGAPFKEAAAALCETKNADSYLSLFALGIICNALIYIAVDGFKNNPHEVGKYLALIFGVTVFILTGTEHSVADMYYYCMSGMIFSVDSILRIIVITLGNVVGGLIIPGGKILAKKLEK